MGKSCIIEPKSGEEMDEYIANSPQAIVEFYWNKCPHCKNLTKTIEEECRNLPKNSPVPVLKCDVEKDWCQQRWLETKPGDVPANKYGVPQTMGISPERGYSDPVWHISGEKHDAIRAVFGKLRSAIEKYNNQQSSQNVQRRQVRNSGAMDAQYQRMEHRYDRFNDYITAPGPKEMVKFRSKPRPNVPRICFPPHCDKQTSDRSIAQFLLYPL